MSYCQQINNCIVLLKSIVNVVFSWVFIVIDIEKHQNSFNKLRASGVLQEIMKKAKTRFVEAAENLPEK